MTKFLTTTAVLLAIVAVVPAQVKTSINGLSASTLTMNGLTVNGVDASGPAIENDGAFVTALRKCANC